MNNEIKIDNSNNLISNIQSYDMIIYLFWAVVLLSFLKLFFSKNVDEYFKKIIWWLSILVFALVSENNYIIWISLFIWWLLIATENFLIHLAWIFSNKKWDDLSRIYDSFSWKSDNNIEEEKITEEQKIDEIKKEKEEKNEIKEEINKDFKQKFPNKYSISLYKDIIETESKILDSFENKFLSSIDGNLERDIRIKNKYWNITLDWIIKDNKEYLLWLEVKILRSSTHISMHIRRYIERIRYMKFNFPFVLIIGSEKFDFDELNRVKNIFWEFDDIFLLFFEYWENVESWKFLNDFNFSKIINKNNETWYWRIINVDWDLITVQFENWSIKTLNRNEIMHWK